MSAPMKIKRWIVRPQDGTTVADVLRAARESDRAVEEGRVFVGKQRVRSPTAKVKPGDEVRIGVANERRADAAPAPVTILFDDDELVACVKPAGIPTVPDHAGASHALVSRVEGQLALPASSLRVTSRLDREVSGVVIFARSERAEMRLKQARAEGAYARRYVAIASHADVFRREAARSGTWDAAIGRAPDPRLRAIARPGTPQGMDAKEARTSFAVVAIASTSFALLAVGPQTGRTHQIRLHASHAGAPLFGDRDYGGPHRVTLGSGAVVALGRIALHAAKVIVPGRDGRPVVAEAPIPDELRRAWTALGGADEAWDTAVSCSLA